MIYRIGSIPYDSNYLEHFGILGMKWGVRRYQNPDGSLTSAGKARYGVDGNGSKEKIGYRFGDHIRNYSKKSEERRIQRGKELREKGRSKTSILLRPTTESVAYALGATAMTFMITKGMLKPVDALDTKTILANTALRFLEAAAFSRMVSDLVAVNAYDKSIAKQEDSAKRKRK